MRKVTRGDINRENMVTLGYCQCQTVLNMFGYNNKIGYNAGVYGWNYDLYEINGCSIVTGYNVPYHKYNNKEKKEKLIELENMIRSMSISEIEKNRNVLKKEFFSFFE